MNKVFSLSVGIGFAMLACATVVSAQQDESANPEVSQQDINVQSFLKKYGARPPEIEQPAKEQKETQESQFGLPPSKLEIVPETPDVEQQPVPAEEPYKSLHERSVWERLKVPPRDVEKETEQQSTQQTEINDQLQPGSQEKKSTQQTPDHYNIFR